jgi:hypothetical protein
MQLFLALRVFWKVLLDRGVADQVKKVLEDKQPPKETTPTLPPSAPAKAPSRSEAITLLTTLQREARFVDIVKEPLDNYTDAQVGAAARDVLRDCAGVLDRLFDVQPLTEQEEGSPIETPAGYDTGKFRLTGNLQGEPPFQGALVHHGWQATRCDLPQWSGSDAAANVIAPMEVEVK